ADIDIERLRNDRRHSNTFDSTREQEARVIRSSQSVSDLKEYFSPLQPVDPTPFVPSDAGSRSERCREILSIQAWGLMQRLRATGMKKVVIGISGGLDSTLALLVAVKAFEMLGIERSNIVGITMPGFGTTDRTHSNAWRLMQELGVTPIEIPIGEAVQQHFAAIGHDGVTLDATYENSQARERTQILMDYANRIGGLVVGTGDLSELALGWCTYNADQMSMYGVNASVPKTLVRHLIEWYADCEATPEVARLLRDIADTPISPELLPAKDNGEIDQKTEDLVGPYLLHDFFLYHVLRNGFRPLKIYMLACNAFEGVYDTSVIRHWMRNFYRRFFSQQFKRSVMPDGPKVGSVCLSPRGDWRMPSDASSRMWLDEVDNLEHLLSKDCI
ncbi:MAG: NAD(+) synthase, partial [Muribaculaceae bacterium]|nr:NAD(+) synthase [Muribaculaceae bacterium]